MLDFYKAIEQLKSNIHLPQRVCSVKLIDSLGCFLAENLQAKHDAPLFNNSAMDGYALSNPHGTLTEFELVGRVAAGEFTDVALEEGEAVRIFTGAPTPLNTTTVEMQEYIEVVGNVVKTSGVVNQGLNIRYCGEEVQEGELLLAKGREMTAATIALCASQGYTHVPVYEGLNITVLSTGDELLNPDEELKKGKIYDANRYMLQAWLSKAHNVTDAGVIVDDYERTKQKLQLIANDQDVIVISGGASVGEEDYVGRAIMEIGQLEGWKVAIKPGKPFGWGKIGDAWVFMLPGNPVSAYVTFYLFVYPLLQNAIGSNAPVYLNGVARFERQKREPRREFLRGIYAQESDGDYSLKIAEGQGSAMLSGLAIANCLIEVEPNTQVSEGMNMRFYPIQ